MASSLGSWGFFMDVGWEFWVELLVVVGAIVVGVRMGGIGLGLWGVAGVGVLVFVFGLAARARHPAPRC